MISLRKLAQSCAVVGALALAAAPANAGFLFGYVVGSAMSGQTAQSGNVSPAVVPYYPMLCYLEARHGGKCWLGSDAYTLEQRCVMLHPSAVPVGVQVVDASSFVLYCGYKQEQPK